MVGCPGCGTDNPDGARFCNQCGIRLSRDDAPRRLRKTITVLFCDIVGSTSRGEAMDIEPLREILERYFVDMRSIVERHGGTVEKFIGDAVMGVFGARTAREDDALRALRAAVEMRAVLTELDIQARIGVNTGEVVVATGEEINVVGDAVNVAARLQTAAAPGEILAGATTIALAPGSVTAEALPALAVKGKSQPVDAFRVVAVSDRAARANEAGFVGRADELALLRAALERTARDGTCEVFTVIGEPGVGKSRLVAELVDGVDARVVRSRCVSYGEGITYLPVVEAIKQLGVLPDDAEAAAPLRALLGETSAGTSSEEIAWAFRKLLEQESPLLLVFDDLQWGEPRFLDLVERIPSYWSGRGLLIVCLVRPELEERRPGWPLSLRLRPLRETEVRELLPPSLRESLREGIVRRAGGNPLFVTEMLAMATHAVDEVVVPATLKALLAARLDQLAATERTVLEGGSVEGELFHRGAVRALTSPETDVTHALVSLVRNEVVHPTTAEIGHEDAFRFSHLLMRDAAYEALPKAVRADLHERFADWLGTLGAVLVERDELMGFHLEQAQRYRRELGAGDDALAARAASHLARAGLRAGSRSDFDASANLLERALALDVEDPRERLELELELGRAYGATRRIADAEPLLARVADEATTLGRAPLASVAQVLRMWNQTGSPRFDSAEAQAVADEAIRNLTAVGDDAGLVPALRLRGLSLAQRGRIDAAGVEFERALEHAEVVGQTELVRSALNTYVNNYLTNGPTPASRGIERCEELLGRAQHDRVLAATIKRPLALFYAMVGRSQEALDLLDEAAAVLDELKLRNMQVYRHTVGNARYLAGDFDGAVSELQATCAYFDELTGARRDGRALGAAGALAWIYCDRQRWDDAASVLHDYPNVSRGVSATRDVSRTAVEARLLAMRGLHDEAGARAAEAVAAADRLPHVPGARATAWAAAAEVRRAAGDAEGAEAALTRALAAYAEKGNLVAAERLRAAASNGA